MNERKLRTPHEIVVASPVPGGYVVEVCVVETDVSLSTVRNVPHLLGQPVDLE